MKTVKEVSELTGISIRTLHYYDEINLFKPTKLAQSGYRLYDDESLEILQQILFYRELDFKLSDIKNIISSPSFNKLKALKGHKKLLLLKKTRLNNLIKLIDETLERGFKMEFNEFDYKKIEEAKEKYKDEVEERWGSTEAFKESQRRTSSYGEEDWKRIQAQASEITMGFVDNMDKDPGDKEVQDLVKRWQQHITDNFYDCKKEILAGLGKMYVVDERFTKNIDAVKKGLAKFISEAIEIYCS